MTPAPGPAPSSQSASTPAAQPRGQSDQPAADIRRQVVNFLSLRLDRSFRLLPDADKQAAREQFLRAVETPPEGAEGWISLSYSTVGLKRDADLLLWRIAFDVDVFQAHTAAINRTTLGGYLETTHSFLAMTKRSQYIDPVDPFHDSESRTRIIPGRRRYLFVYPFVKTRPWYLLPLEKRQEMMANHIRVGNKYPSVKLNTTYSFGLDDQDFVVAFETDVVKDFLDLVQELRETEASLYTQRDTPMFTAVRKAMSEVLGEMF